MDFSLALVKVKEGKKITRSGWNGANQFIFKVGDKIDTVGQYCFAPYLVLKNAQGIIQPGWIPSQGDLFADDWEIL